ncbi:MULTISPECIES: hypothetical protein [unclassified Shewanella]|uniref:hypothetical protein n=1 Tax=unclassified Shewanella TaxID=196818 RepID=UPI00200408F9|nr:MULTISPECIES: hypothetical protein [unclassified Shewanella]MCK7632645.1 hypothetical protein [Shewanella sp. JNE17]MCK7648157.1 hypothetical protein [Shewanella sp. JNE8]MCK7655950.1 hypothetical protein [Shewanella sp. JNE4-2]UPO32498.1 hypothetical protein MZ182_06585 [Shewanella sp. JNE2]
MEDNEVKIYFGGDLTNLYEIGWLSSDLSQLVDFAELVESGEKERTEKFFGEKSRPFNRYTKVVDKPHKRPEIVDVRKGSVELIIAGCSVAATVIMPLVQIAVQRYFAARDEEVSFQISPKDTNLQRIMNSYANGDFGLGTEGLTMLMAILEQRNYNVTLLAQNIYLVEHVVDKYAQRMIKTIKKNRPNS